MSEKVKIKLIGKIINFLWKEFDKQSVMISHDNLVLIDKSKNLKMLFNIDKLLNLTMPLNKVMKLWVSKLILLLKDLLNILREKEDGEYFLEPNSENELVYVNEIKNSNKEYTKAKLYECSEDSEEYTDFQSYVDSEGEISFKFREKVLPLVIWLSKTQGKKQTVIRISNDWRLTMSCENSFFTKFECSYSWDASKLLWGMEFKDFVFNFEDAMKYIKLAIIEDGKHDFYVDNTLSASISQKEWNYYVKFDSPHVKVELPLEEGASYSNKIFESQSYAKISVNVSNIKRTVNRFIGYKIVNNKKKSWLYLPSMIFEQENLIFRYDEYSSENEADLGNDSEKDYDYKSDNLVAYKSDNNELLIWKEVKLVLQHLMEAIKTGYFNIDWKMDISFKKSEAWEFISFKHKFDDGATLETCSAISILLGEQRKSLLRKDSIELTKLASTKEELIPQEETLF